MLPRVATQRVHTKGQSSNPRQEFALEVECTIPMDKLRRRQFENGTVSVNNNYLSVSVLVAGNLGRF